LTPGVQAQKRDPDRLVAVLVQPRQRQGLDRGAPVRADGGVRIEQTRQVTLDQGAERVAGEPGFVMEVPPRFIAAFADQLLGGFVEGVPQLRDGDFGEPGGAGCVPGQFAQRGRDRGLVGGSERACLTGSPERLGRSPRDRNRPAAPWRVPRRCSSPERR
jgi:hypothetical protein